MLLPLLALILIIGCKGERIDSHWTNKPIEVDGLISDWTDLPKRYFEKVGASVGLSNDADNLYILFRFNNHEWLPLLSQGGLTLWLDPLAKKREDFGIRYFAILPTDTARFRNMPERPPVQTSGKRLNMPKIQKRVMEEVIVLNEGKQLNSVPPNGSFGIAASKGNEDGIYTYELSISLADEDPLKYAIGTAPGQEISLGFEIAGMSGGDSPPMQGDRGGMSGRMPPGSGKNGHRMGQRPLMPSMPEGVKFWVKTTLAENPYPFQMSEGY
jgi:hypothetical protein